MEDKSESLRNSSPVLIRDIISDIRGFNSGLLTRPNAGNWTKDISEGTDGRDGKKGLAAVTRVAVGRCELRCQVSVYR